MADSKNGKNQAYSDAYKALVKSLGGRTSGYIPNLGQLYGVKAGLLLSQLIYWQTRYPDSEFYVTVSNLYEQTGLNAEEQRNARERLCRAGVLHAVIKGFPRNWHYQVLIPELVGQCSHSSRKSINGKVNQWESQSMRKSITEKVHSIDGESPSPLVEKVHLHWWRKSTNGALAIKGIKKDYLKDYNIRLTPPPPGEISDFEQPQEEEVSEEKAEPVWMSETFLEDVKTYGVFANNLIEIETALRRGWSEEAIRELMQVIQNDARLLSKPGALLHRLREMDPPTAAKKRKFQVCADCGQLVEMCVCGEG